MLAVTCVSQSATDPLSGLEVGERPEPQVPDGWTTVRLRTTALNHHDIFSLRGVGLPADRLPMVLGCDGAGVDADGNEVLVHAVVASPGWAGDETLDPRRSLLSEVHDGTLAEVVAVPRHNLVPKPAGLSWEHAACLPTAWLTAYRMLFTNSGRAARRHGAGAGRGRRRRHGPGAARNRGRAPDVGDQPGCRPRRAGGRARRRPCLRERGPAARAGRRGHGDGRGGHLVALGEQPAPRRHHRHLRRHVRRRPRQGRADQDLLQAAAGHRVDDGHPRRARAAGPLRRRRRHRAAGRLGATARAGPRGLRADGRRARSRARSSSPSDPRGPACGTRHGRRAEIATGR